MWENQDYKFTLEGLSFNNHKIAGSEEFSIATVDSGTTFTYIPYQLFNMLIVHFDWFCGLDATNHCKGEIIDKSKDTGNICFSYDEKRFPEGPKKYFMSYPVLNFHATASNGSKIVLKWYPSEYLFREHTTKYCMAIERYTRPGEILMGGTFMR